MAKKFLDAEEAAKLLGVSVDTLNDMREHHELYPMRDAGQWKYKQDEIERLVAERNERGESDEGPAHYSDADGGDSVLLSEVELGASDASPSSTVIGKNQGSADSDIRLADPDKPSSDSGLIGASDVRLATGSEIVKAGSGLSAKFDELDTLDLELPPPPGSSKSGSGKSGSTKRGMERSSASGSGILSLDDDDDILSLADEPRGPTAGSSSKHRAGSDGSALDLAGDDDELVLGGSGPGSDITHAVGDSGISLVDLSDSGIALDEAPLDLHGTNANKNSLDLSAGDDDLILLEEDADPNIATQLKADDDFLLTPMVEASGEDSDSGSQVIALDGDGDFDESARTMLGSGMSMGAAGLGAGGMLEEDLGGFGGGLQAEGDPLGGPGGGMPLAAPQPAMMTMAPLQVKEAPFSGPWVAFLGLGVVLIMLSGMMMFDLLRNMWSWDGPYAINSSLMDGIMDAFGIK